MAHPASPTPSPADLLTQEQAAAILGISPGTLENWRTTRRYDLPYVKIGNRVRYRRADLFTFIRSRIVDPSHREEG